MPQDGQGRWREEEGRSELWIYTDSESYAPGDTVSIMASSTVAKQAVIEFVRYDSPSPQVVHETAPFEVGYHPAPERAFAVGCGWPVATTFTIPSDWTSGFYIMNAKCVGPGADAGLDTPRLPAYAPGLPGLGPAIAEHFFVLRPALLSEAPPDKERLLLILSTNTWTSYNKYPNPQPPLPPVPLPPAPCPSARPLPGRC